MESAKDIDLATVSFDHYLLHLAQTNKLTDDLTDAVRFNAGAFERHPVLTGRYSRRTLPDNFIVRYTTGHHGRGSDQAETVFCHFIDTEIETLTVHTGLRWVGKKMIVEELYDDYVRMAITAQRFIVEAVHSESKVKLFARNDGSLFNYPVMHLSPVRIPDYQDFED